MQEVVYPAVRIQQEGGFKPLILFAAPAVDINNWVGVPQKLQLGEDETSGFQRTVSPARRDALRHFFENPENTMQNPLLCAIRNPAGVAVRFESSGSPEGNDCGHLHISIPELKLVPLVELFRRVRLYLEERVPTLVDRPFPEDVYRKIEQLVLGVHTQNSDNEAELQTPDDSGQETMETELEEALFDDSQIAEFWDQIKAREHMAEKLRDKGPINELVGFTREVLEAYLRPVVLVDGQHRLAGAIAAARAFVEEDPQARREAQSLVSERGMTADAALTQIMRQKSRLLPISLLLNESPAEHVFQFVVVNQKATPVPKALLGTIISTSLAPAELSSIKARLVRADIPLESSQAVSSLARSVNSPFANRVARGFEPDSGSKLPWTVLATLAELFRGLKGAKYYHDPMLDHAAIWKEHNLEKSAIVADWQARDFSSASAYWADPNGPWRDVFIAFWSHVRDKLASIDNSEANNYWGSPRLSNIFNKPSLFILSVDFFSFLREQRVGIDSAEHVKNLVDEWLSYVSPTYFARDWNLSGVKKDAVGTRRQWSYLWCKHRSGGSDIPKVDEFSKLRRD
jgi:hypothetical protein